MKLSRVLTCSLLALGLAGGAVGAPATAWPDQGYVAYHYDEYNNLVAVSGLNCDGTTYHYPLIMGHTTDYQYFDC